MYAERRYHSSQHRGASLGAAFLINGAVIAGIAFFLAPRYVFAPKDPPMTVTTIPIDEPPPPIEQPKPKPDPRTSTEPPIVTPIPQVPVERTETVATTTVIPDTPPAPGPAERTGTTTIVSEPTPLPPPPLIAAAKDARYAADFQPPYPASELRAQRDGQVSVRVLIGTDGRVKAVEQVSATSAAFFEATKRQALAKWRFRAATRGDVPQESWKVMNVRFELKNQ